MGSPLAEPERSSMYRAKVKRVSWSVGMNPWYKFTVEAVCLVIRVPQVIAVTVRVPRTLEYEYLTRKEVKAKVSKLFQHRGHKS